MLADIPKAFESSRLITTLRSISHEQKLARGFLMMILKVFGTRSKILRQQFRRDGPMEELATW
jgi:hypothetical protein